MSASKTRTSFQFGLFSAIKRWWDGHRRHRRLLGIEDDVQRHVKVAVVHRSRQVGIGSATCEIDDTRVAAEVRPTVT